MTMTFWGKACAVLVAIAGVLAAAFVLYLQHPLFGALPHGERLARVQASQHYEDGAFQNLVDTPFLTQGATQWSIRIDNFLADKGALRPTGEIPTRKTDLRALNPHEDLTIWLGHSSWYVQLGGQRILIDPVFSTYAAPLPGVIPAFEGTNHYAAQDLPPIDVLLITHDHYDHLDYATMVALQPLVKQAVTGVGTGAHLAAWGYRADQIHELDWYDTQGLGDGLRVHATPARHYSGRTFTRNQSLWVGFVLETPQRRVFFSGDSGYGEHFTDIGRRYGDFDWVTLDSGQYDPRWAHLHMTPEQAAQAAEDLRARALSPAHVGRFALASHDWNAPFERIVMASQGRDFALWTPMIGQPVYLDGRAQAFQPWWRAVD